MLMSDLWLKQRGKNDDFDVTPCSGTDSRTYKDTPTNDLLFNDPF